MIKAVKYVRIVIPKFTMKLKYTLKNTFVKLGIKDLFSLACNLSSRTETKVSVSNIFHDTFINVNQEGTEAGGATAVVVNKMGVFNPPEYFADHPFMKKFGMKGQRVSCLWKLCDPWNEWACPHQAAQICTMVANAKFFTSYHVLYHWVGFNMIRPVMRQIANSLMLSLIKLVRHTSYHV